MYILQYSFYLNLDSSNQSDTYHNIYIYTGRMRSSVHKLGPVVNNNKKNILENKTIIKST